MTNRDRSPLASHWTLDPAVDFLNHGSYGACPRVVLETQAELRRQLEAQPVRFFQRDAPTLLDRAREELAAFVGADANELAFVNNATTGVNTVLRSLTFGPGDELLVTDHAYNACRNAIDFAASHGGARLVVAQVPFPLTSSAQVVDAVLAARTPRTKLALLDHVTSPTGLVFPLEQLVPALQAHGVRVLIDGAHAPGMLPLDLHALGADYYTGNFHKWLCTPKSAAFLYVPRRHQAEIRPLVISHGANARPDPDRSRFWLEFDWTGTSDPTPQLCIPAALAFLRGLPGGLAGHYAVNRSLALAARGVLCDALDIAAPAPDSMIGSLVALPLADGSGHQLHDELIDQAAIEVPIMPWPAAPRRLVRISAQRYNDLAQYERLAAALKAHA
jgi:isopenicillin-N epimerase